MFKRLILGIGILLFLFCSLGFCATYYVSVNGCDSNNGSKEAPWRSIQYGIERLKPGDTLLVGGGTYNESLNISLQGTRDRRITIKNVKGERPLIKGQVTITGSYITFGGFERVGGKRGIRLEGARHCIIENNLIHDYEKTGIHLGYGTQHSLIRHNEIYGGNKGIMTYSPDCCFNIIEYNISYGNYKNPSGADGLRIDKGSHHMIIRHNIFHHNADDGVDGQGGGDYHTIEYNISHHNGLFMDGSKGYDGAGFKTNGLKYSIFRYNIAYKNTKRGLCNSTQPSDVNLYYNNTCYDNGREYECHAIYVNNVGCGNKTDLQQTGNNIIGTLKDAKKWFVDPENGDFRLKPGSPLIDAGRVKISDDISIHSYVGSAPDIGAYEYGKEEKVFEQPGLFDAREAKIYTIKGFIKDSNGKPIIGATVNLYGTKTGSYLTGTTGFYSFDNLPPGNYTVIPSKPGYTFSPSKYNYSSLNDYQLDQDFEGKKK